MADLIRKSPDTRPVVCALVVLLSVIVIASAGEPLNPLWHASKESSMQEAGYDDLRLPEPGKPFASEISSGQTRSFRISLDSGQCLRVVVDHWGINIDVTWYGPGGQKVTEVGCRLSEPTPVTLV